MHIYIYIHTRMCVSSPNRNSHIWPRSFSKLSCFPLLFLSCPDLSLLWLKSWVTTRKRGQARTKQERGSVRKRLLLHMHPSFSCSWAFEEDDADNQRRFKSESWWEPVDLLDDGTWVAAKLGHISPSASNHANCTPFRPVLLSTFLGQTDGAKARKERRSLTAEVGAPES